MLRRGIWNVRWLALALLFVPGVAQAQIEFGRAPTTLVLASSTTNVSNAGTSEEVLATYTIKGGTLAQEGDSILLWLRTSSAANANAKTLRIRLGGIAGTQLFSITAGNNLQHAFNVRIMRIDATNQDTFTDGYPVAGAYQIAPVVAGTATLANDVDLVITAQCTVAASDLTLLAYTVSLWKK